MTPHAPVSSSAEGAMTAVLSQGYCEDEGKLPLQTPRVARQRAGTHHMSLQVGPRAPCPVPGTLGLVFIAFILKPSFVSFFLVCPLLIPSPLALPFPPSTWQHVPEPGPWMPCQQSHLVPRTAGPPWMAPQLTLGLAVRQAFLSWTSPHGAGGQHMNSPLL